MWVPVSRGTCWGRSAPVTQPRCSMKARPPPAQHRDKGPLSQDGPVYKLGAHVQEERTLGWACGRLATSSVAEGPLTRTGGDELFNSSRTKRVPMKGLKSRLSEGGRRPV